MIRVWIVVLACFIFAQSTYAFDMMDVKYKKIKDIAYEENGNIFTLPYLLEKGNRWKILEKGKKVYAAVTVETGTDPVEISLPTTEIEGKTYINFTFFSKQAGLTYQFNKEKTEIYLKAYKKEKLLEKEGKILLMWDPDLIFDVNKSYFTKKVGRRVLAPTWGSYKKIKEKPLPLSYLEKVKDEGIGITPLLHNGFDLYETKKLIRDPLAVQILAKELAAIAIVYDFDGWNLDFENMDEADKHLYTKFVEEVSRQLHNHGKEVSVDITAYSDSPNWSLCYDRGAMADYVDYEIMMGYDQTPRASRFAGSVASYRWLNHQVSMIKEVVPANKLVLGLPFYTRLWTGEDGQATSDVLTIRNVNSFLKNHKVKTFWNTDDHQYVGIWNEGGKKKKVWFEESRSLKDKVLLAYDYGLAGLAFWRYGFEREEIYGNLEEIILNEEDVYGRYKKENRSVK